MDVCEGAVWRRGIMAPEEVIDDKGRSNCRPIGDNDSSGSSSKKAVGRRLENTSDLSRKN